MIETATLAHFVRAVFVRPACGTSNTASLGVLLCHHKVIPAFVALVLMERTVDPTFHLVEFILLTECDGANSRIKLSERIFQAHLVCLERLLRANGGGS